MSPASHAVTHDRRTRVDLGLLLALLLVTLAGLAPTYQGWGFLVVGLAGAVLSAGALLLVRALAWPSITAVLLTLALYYLAGGPACLRGEGTSASLPGPTSARLLTHEAVFGWKDLLTTLPPLDASGPLLALPFILGLAGGLAGMLLAGVEPGPARVGAALPLLSPLVLLALVILLGVHRPQSLWLQGVGFAVLALVWLVVRHDRSGGAVRDTASRLRRTTTGGALLAAAALLALPVGTWAAGGDSGRTVLRTYVSPPFDIGQYPSPLASYRRYVPEPARSHDPQNLHDQTLFTITGVPAGTRVRIATLDHYDGVVYGASNGSEPGPVDDTFQRVSSSIDDPVAGTPVQGTVTLGPGYSGVWLPVAGALQHLRFESGDTGAMAETFRYNLATSTGVVPSGLVPGNSWSYSAVLPDQRLSARDVPGAPLVETAVDGAFLDTLAAKWAQGASAPMQQLFAIARHLKNDGKFSDGVTRAERVYHAGHNEFRLADDQGGVNSRGIVGDDEQYAAWMSLLANQVGVPARVVFGAVVPAGGVVTGADVHAWVEVRVGDGSWRTLPTSAFMDHDKPATLPPQSQQQMTGAVVPPPQPIPPPSSAGDQSDTDMRAQKSRHTTTTPPPTTSRAAAWVGRVVTYVGVPVLLVAAVVGGILGAKLLRRRRRRTAPRISSRFVGGWHELVDHARDLGQPIPVGMVTRREQAGWFADPASRAAAPGLARTADRHVFGPASPAAEAAEAFWRAVDAERRAMSASADRGRRIRAALAVRTFRRV
ncbi:transglutaminase-like domain-containing protein [Nocardioides cynanchi]|uniref:transglutaminase-like domain-containing protein n=1 Tax=Nocardioides cynanchi TaxID=2558918 RepID=UPI001244BC0D|nr:transglutaminase-like domain-containing protein [Nocardioides cynanchi]